MSLPDRHTATGRDEAVSSESGSPANPPALPRVGDLVAGRYEVLRALGTGATGHVFLARHTSLDTQLALKVLSPKAAQEPEQAERFLREARAASGLRHPRIVEITDFGSTEDGLPFLAMEYLAGEDLAACLARSSRLPWPRARALILEVLDGLACAHAHGVVHRDLKPENIFLAQRDDPEPGSSVKLVDFGIAKLLTEPKAGRLTSDGHILGTPQYMSPEQAVGKHVDARSDLYACGILLFEMLTGSLPFSDGSTMAILSQQITQAPPTLASAAPDLDLEALPELEVIVARALHKDPDQRYATADELAEAIRGVGRTPVAEPEGHKPARWWVALTVLAVLAVVGAVVGTVVGTGIGTGIGSEGDDIDRGGAPTVAEAAAPTPRPSPPAADASSRQASVEAATAQAPTTVATVATAETEPSGAEPGDAVEDARDRRPDAAALDVTERRKKAPAPDQPRAKAPAPVTAPTLPDRVSDETAAKHLRRAASRCSAFVSRGGQDLDIEVNIASDGDIFGAVPQPPYGGDHPLGRCVAKVLNGATVPAAVHGRVYRGTIRLVQAPATTP